MLATLALLAVSGLFLLMAGCSSKPPRANVESMFADYMKDKYYHDVDHIKSIDITNDYKRTVDEESRYYYDADISIFRGTQFVSEYGAVAKLIVWRGSISCVKRGKEWYWQAESLPEIAQKNYTLSADEQSSVAAGCKKAQEAVRQIEAGRSKVAEMLQSFSSTQQVEAFKPSVDNELSAYKNVLKSNDGSTLEVQQMKQLIQEIDNAIQQRACDLLPKFEGYKPVPNLIVPTPDAKSDSQGKGSGTVGGASPAIDASLLQAATQGEIEAQVDLASIYANGVGVPKDEAKAVEWYRKAAGQGCAVAQRKLGIMYEEGTGVDKDYAKAIEWYQKAAVQDDVQAQMFVASMYAAAKGVTKDDVRACAWLYVASYTGNQLASTALEKAEQRLTAGQKVEAQKLAKTLLETAATPSTTRPR